MERVTCIEESASIPEDAVVLHYDELDADSKHCFQSLVEDTPLKDCSLQNIDLASDIYVKFTDYYRISRQ